MKIIKNITLLVALTMPFVIPAYEWADFQKNAKISLEGICKFSFTISGIMLIGLCSAGYGNGIIILRHQDMMERFKDNPAKIAECNAWYQEAVKNRVLFKGIMRILLPISILSYLGVCFFESINKSIESTDKPIESIK